MGQKFAVRESPTVLDLFTASLVGQVFLAYPADNGDPADGFSDMVHRFPSGRVFRTITQAIGAARAGMPDYVLVCAHDDHDSDAWTEDVTASKDNIHLIGINKPKIDGTGDLFTVSGDNVEIAGFWMSPASAKSGVVVDACDFLFVHDNFIVCEASASGTIGIEIGNTTAAHNVLVKDNFIKDGINGIFLELGHHNRIIGNTIVTTANSAIGINETHNSTNALYLLFAENTILQAGTGTTGILLTNDTAASHVVTKNRIAGSATAITQDKWDEGVLSDNVIYGGTAAIVVVDPTA